MSLTSRTPSLGAVLLLVVAVVLLISGGGDGAGERDGRGGEPRDRGAGRDEPPGHDDSSRGAPALVTRVVDGDTVEVRLGGREEDVRYIGVDTPESVAPGQPVECYGKDASEFNRSLVEGERVRLEYGAERRDVYGRLLAYVYLRGDLVNAELLQRGYARTLAIAPNTDRAGLFDRIEQRAANAGRGLWGAC